MFISISLCTTIGIHVHAYNSCKKKTKQRQKSKKNKDQYTKRFIYKYVFFFHHGLHMSVPFDSLLVISLVMSESFWPNWVEDKENVVLFWPRWLVKLFKRCTESVLSKATLSLIRGTVCGWKVNFCSGCKFAMVGWFTCAGLEELVVTTKGERHGAEEVLILMGWTRRMKTLEHGTEALLYCKTPEAGTRYATCPEAALTLADCVLYTKLLAMLFWFWTDNHSVASQVLPFTLWFVSFWVSTDWFVVITELVLSTFAVRFWFGQARCIRSCICWLGINGIWESEFSESWSEDMVTVVRWFSRRDRKSVSTPSVFSRYWLTLLAHSLNPSRYLFILDTLFPSVAKMTKNKIIHVHVYA